jgi:ribosomal protein S18 acetylase RimI-like enzyme
LAGRMEELEGARLRPVTELDLEGVVRLHETAFDGFLMTRLGPSFLFQYYKVVCDYGDRVFVAAEEKGGNLLGFVAGFRRPKAFYEMLRGRRWRMAMAMSPALVRHPSLLKRALRNSASVRDRSVTLSDELHCELASIAVAPEASGRGIGRTLVHAFCKHAAEAGARSVYLTTEVHNNVAVNRFYGSLGFLVTDTFDAGGGRLMHKYVVTLDPQGVIQGVDHRSGEC